MQIEHSQEAMCGQKSAQEHLTRPEIFEYRQVVNGSGFVAHIRNNTRKIVGMSRIIVYIQLLRHIRQGVRERNVILNSCQCQSRTPRSQCQRVYVVLAQGFQGKVIGSGIRRYSAPVRIKQAQRRADLYCHLFSFLREPPFEAAFLCFCSIVLVRNHTECPATRRRDGRFQSVHCTCPP